MQIGGRGRGGTIITRSDPEQSCLTVSLVPQPTVDPRISFRPLTRADFGMLHEWLNRRHVAEWWQPVPTLEMLEDDFGPAIDGIVPHRCFIALLNGEPLGFIQVYTPVGFHHEGWWLDEHDPGVRGIDQFLANSAQLGRGLGSAMVRAFVARLFADPAVTRVQTDPSPENARAIRAYEKAGFLADRVVETPDGPALLMYCERPSR